MAFCMTVQEVFKALQQTGLGVVDIGSRDGLHSMFKEVASLVEAVGFEPDIKECERLNERLGKDAAYRSLTFLPFGLGSGDGQQVLNLCRSRGVSSVYRPNRSFLDRFPDAHRFDVVDTVSIPVRGFDGLLKDPKVRLPNNIDFIKIDTQGSELDILHGARETLRNQVVAVEVEIEFARLYESQSLFREVDSFLSECGFTLFKLRRVEWVRRNYEHRPHLSAGQLVFGDALYLRDPLDPQVLWMPKDSRQSEALVLISLLYDLHDFALEVISAPGITPMLDAGKIRQYVTHRSNQLNRPWNQVHTVRDLLRWFKDSLGCFRRYKSHWGRGDGNFYAR